LDQSLDQTVRPIAERKFRTVSSAKKIRDERKIGAVNLCKQQRWTTGGDNTTMDFCDFEVGVDGSRNLNKIPVMP
jgi:hypothetical protein|tara:strand:- start:113 stop:337 length:225 start_codon:yes stop_codon:yes gene_type:complete